MLKKKEKIVYIIHSVDTEGPLYEPLEATFDRLYDLFGIKFEPTRENLKKLQNKEIDFGVNTNIIAEVFNTHSLQYNDTWDKIDNMLINVMGSQFRNEVLDSFGSGWIYNWHCVDHVGYMYNPR